MRASERVLLHERRAASRCLALAAIVLWSGAGGCVHAAGARAGLGLFESHEDVGQNPVAGSAAYASSSGEYRIVGGGANMWETTDAFHFAWRRMSGDFTLTADVKFAHAGGNEHRKAGWIVRQDLGPSAAYVDAIVHGDGLTSLQFRPAPGAPTDEVRAEMTGPTQIRLVKKQDT